MALNKVLNINDLYKPYPPQKRFHESPEKYRLFGGAAGPGKTHAIRWEAVLRSIKYQFPITGAIFRKSYPELESTIIRGIREMLPNWAYKYNQAQHIMTLFNGSIIEFCYAESDDDVYRYQSREWDWLGIDELTHFTEFQFLYLMSRVRTTKPIQTKFFAGTNPGNIGHCVPYGDVLTPNGWMSIKDIKENNLVMTLLDDGSIDYVRVNQKVEEDYEGDLYISNSPNAQFVCTPNHKIVRVTETKNKNGRTFHDPSLVKVENLKDVTRLPKVGTWNSSSPKFFELDDISHRKLKHKQPLKINFEDYCEFMGWFLSEGSTIKTECRIIISQSKEEERNIIERLLNRCGFHYKKYKNSFVFYSPAWHKYLQQFGNCREKFIPNIIKRSGRRTLKIFFDAVMLGDGDKNNNYYTLSKNLVGDMEEIGLKLGFRTRTTSRLRKNRKYVSYAIKFKQNRLGWLEKKNIHKEKYKGKVYCIGIDKLHRFYLRQNGTVYLSGNSWVKKRWITKDCTDNAYNPDEYVFIPGKVTDNKILMKSNPDYIKNLQMLPDKERRALLDGDWDVFEGQFFNEWSPSKHVVEDFEVPEDWRLILGWDDGTKAPRAVNLYAIDNDQKIWCIWEYYKEGENLTVAAENIRRELKEKGYWGRIYKLVVDPSMKRTDSQTGLSSVEVLEQMGFGFVIGEVELGNNNRKEGWRIMKSYLSYKPYEEPVLKFFKSCGNMIRTIPQMIYYQSRSGIMSKKEDLSTDLEDHCVDNARYVLMSLDRLPSRFEGNTLIKIKRRKYVPRSSFN